MSRPAPRRRVQRASFATAVGCLIAVTGSTVASAAPAPFTDEQLKHPYASNAAYPYELIMDQFTQLREDAEIVAFNDASTVKINQGTTPEQSERAIVDQYADMSVSMSDGFGVDLGAAYAQGRADGSLPKTAALLAKNGGLIGAYSSSNPAKEYFSYDRPYIRFAEDLEYRDKEGGDAWGSKSGAFPSGHTSQAYWQGVSLAIMLPELAPQILARTSEAGHNRIVMAAHYPLDVIGGRMMGNNIVERRMADPEFRVLMEEAASELRSYLEAACGDTLSACVDADTPYLSDEDAIDVYTERMTYGFPLVGEPGQPLTVPGHAEVLLATSHPELTAEQRRQVLQLTAIDSGSPLDEGTDGSWQRINLAAAMDAEVEVAADGTVSLVGSGEPGTDEPGTGEPGDGEDPGTPGAPGTDEPGTGTPGTPGTELPETGGPVLPEATELTAGLETLTVRINGAGDAVTVTGGALAGRSLQAVVFSTPQSLGAVQFDAAGSARVALPAGLAPGAHRLAVTDAAGTVVAWGAFTVAAPASATGSLAATGGEAPLALSVAAGSALLLGAGLLVLRRVRRSTAV